MTRLEAGLAALLLLAGAVMCGSQPAQDGPEPIPAAADQVRPLLIGSRAPGGVFPDAEGQAFDLGSALDARPTILVFYRAHW